MEYSISPELAALLKYVREEVAPRYGIDKIDVVPFMLGTLEYDDCEANSVLRSITLTSDYAKMTEELDTHLRNSGDSDSGTGSDGAEYSQKFDAIMKRMCKDGKDSHTSTEFWSVMLSLSQFANKIASRYGITKKQMLEESKRRRGYEENPDNEETSAAESQRQEKIMTNSYVENLLTNLNVAAERGNIPPVFGNGSVLNSIFTVWARRERNNVVLVGEPGVGKTSTVKHIANLFVSGDVPQFLSNRKLMELKLADLMPSNGIKGIFEEQFKSVVNEAHGRDCYVFFIDNVRSGLSDDAHYSDMGIEIIMDMMLSDRNILFICTATPKDYSSLIESNPFFKRRFCRVDLEEKSVEECVDIVDSSKRPLEDFHGVRFSREVIRHCTETAKKRMKQCVLPDTIYDLLDEAGARKSVMDGDTPEMMDAKKKLDEGLALRRDTVDHPARYTEEDINRIDFQLLELKNHLSFLEKQEKMSERSQDITEDDIDDVINGRCGNGSAPTSPDATKNLYERLSAKVIGQDEAVERVSKVVRRQSAGLSDHGKPSVFMFIGSTGTGKTHTAKKLAEEVFGDEKSMVRLDMSEYGDKMSVNKLYGSAPGYVGYENGGQLTEAVKKKGKCVILLDEVEKAADEVHDVLLQVFDDGRLTDNKGVTVDFGDTIIIMTSNVGASEAAARGDGIGFTPNTGMSESVYRNAIRRKFKPEFMNRVDDVIMFKPLSPDDLSKIADIEISAAVKKIEKAGLTVDGSFVEKAKKRVMDSVGDGKMGGRPVKRAVQSVIDDVATLIIDGGRGKGSTLTSADI